MKNPFDPTPEELRDWAYNDGKWPKEDFHVFVGQLKNAEVILELARDPECPSREFFLSCLYLIVGEHFRDEIDKEFLALNKHFQAVCEFVEAADSKGDPLVEAWRERSKELIAHPQQVDDDDWCDGDIAERDMQKLTAGEL